MHPLGIHLVTKKVDPYNLYQWLDISGIPCLVQATKNFGRITGSVSCSLSSKPFRFDIHSQEKKKFQNMNMQEELTRLYFDTRLGE
jgi:hypothetical protein